MMKEVLQIEKCVCLMNDFADAAQLSLAEVKEAKLIQAEKPL